MMHTTPHRFGFRRTPMALLPYQQRWVADDSRVKVYEKSRRIGVSWAEAADDALLASRQNGMNVWYIGYNKEMAREFIEDCSRWAKFFNRAAHHIEETIFRDETKDILSFRIRFSSGRKIAALSSRPTNLRGKQGKVVIDEAAFHDDFQGLMKAAVALLMWGGRVVVISTHFGEDNPFNDLIRDIRVQKYPYRLHRTTLDDALKDGLYHRICIRLGIPWSERSEKMWRQEMIDYYGDAADEELFCIPARSAGSYFTRVMIEACMDERASVFRWTCPGGFEQLPDDHRTREALRFCEENIGPRILELSEHHPTVFGADFGRFGDLTVIWILREDEGLAYRTPFVTELRNVPFRQQEEILFYIGERLPNFKGGALDARGNGQYLAETAMQKFGAYRILQVMLTAQWYRDHMPRYKSVFEDKNITIPKDGDILDDHRMIRITKGIPKIPDNAGNKGRDGNPRHGDSAIAGALAVYAADSMTSRGETAIEFESTRNRRSYTHI